VDIDERIATALPNIAAGLAAEAAAVGLDHLTEEPVFNRIVTTAMDAVFAGEAASAHATLPISNWKPSPGGVDVVVKKTDAGLRVVGELKWCWSKHELGWTLWDIYKLVAVKEQYRADSAYAIVGAPASYWVDEQIDCCALFTSDTWDSREVFTRYWRAWWDLLRGGTARPLSVPSKLRTTLVGSAPVDVSPAWTLRALRVESSESAGVLDFDGDWPRGVAIVDRHRPENPLDRLDRIRGCLLGGAVGDALGAPVEFLSLAEIRATFRAGGITDFAPAFGREGAITDDTQMTLFTAEGLMRAHNRMISKGICSVPDVVWWAYQRWLHTQGESTTKGDYGLDGWLIEVPDLHSRRAPGNTCLSALAGGTPGRVGEPINDSKGCGGVMRVAPVGLLTPNDPFDDGCAVAALTHGHPSGYLAAGYISSVIAKVLAGMPLWNAAVAALDELIIRVKDLTPDERPQGRDCRKAVEHALDLASREGADGDVEVLGGGWVAEEAAAIAIHCALTASSFEDGVQRAVNHSGDSDSTGAIAGNVLGAYFGVAAIPQHWLERLELRNVIEQVAQDLEHHLNGDNIEYSSGWGDVTPEEWERYPGY
jgi:ADP-ribosylglycohydrolase